MFYSETLLAKTGPLAQVWLAANVERKLTKHNVLQQDIIKSVDAIMDQSQAPLALRLSGQLLLGVVRIHSRKARYLQDDCNEAILKIRVAFKPGNVDLPAGARRNNPASLLLPDVLTELDLLAPFDPSFLLDESEDVQTGRGSQVIYSSSQKLDRTPTTVTRMRHLSTEPSGLLEDVGLELDIGDNMSVFGGREQSIEVGRRAVQDRPEETTVMYDEDLPDIDIGQSAALDPSRYQARDDSIMSGMDDDGDIPMPEMGEDYDFQDEAAAAGMAARPPRASQSPLSDVRSSAERELERTFRQPSTEAGDATVVHAQRAKRRKILPADFETEMRSAEVRALQNDRSKILKPAQFLPRDPVLLALMQMQREGNFFSNILGDGLHRGLAPELRGVMSMELVRQSAERKRKRDAGLPTPPPEGDMEDDELHIQIPSDADEPMGQMDDEGFNLNNDHDTTLRPNDPLPSTHSRAGTQEPFNDDEPMNGMDDDEPMGQNNDDVENTFDATHAPPLHPSQSGAISLGTKFAVHFLRNFFGPTPDSADLTLSTPSKRTKASSSSLLFQDMMPETSTTRSQATKMFFEVLVLATKDAVKVEQDVEGSVGGGIRVRGKRGLWGEWADEGAAGAGGEELGVEMETGSGVVEVAA